MEKKWTVHNIQSLHLRPASDLCTIAMEYECKITLRFRDREYNAKSLLSVLSACVQDGDEIEIDFDGPDADAAQKRFAAFFDGLSPENLH